jgi:hypothetical protein
MLVLLSCTISYAGEIEFTGRATILKEDVRSAYKNSLNNALLGGIRRYVQQNLPDRAADITDDYIMFVDNYTILRREVVNNTVVTGVHININPLLTDDIAGYFTNQMNTAVFIMSGLPEYVTENQIRPVVSQSLLEMQFSTNDQLQFEREIIDRKNRYDVLNAFRSVSPQYLFDFKFTLKSYKAEESCTLQSDSSYTPAGSITPTPILLTEVTIEDNDTTACIKGAVKTSIDTALAHLRERLVPFPGEKLVLNKYIIEFQGVSEMRTLNDIMATLERRKYITTFAMNEFFDDEASFSVESYLPIQEFTDNINALSLENTEPAEYDDGKVLIKVIR